jgi:dimethylaniline monooxygenase (N-oxide forming)
VAVIGSSFSGIEVAANLAANGAEVILIFRRPVWLLPRYVDTGKHRIPLDLVFYVRGGHRLDGMMTEEEINFRRGQYYENTFGNPGDIHPSLSLKPDENPPFIAISEHFADFVRSGVIEPQRTTGVRFTEREIVLANGKRIETDAVILCTGFTSDMPFLPETLVRTFRYRPDDHFVPFLADKAVLHPDVPGLGFVGVYRGPYFAVIELQARWVSLLFSGYLTPPSRERSLASIEAENRIRQRRPQPQFPHANYIEFADALAAEIGALPDQHSDPELAIMFEKGPCIPAHYRLFGPHAQHKIAMATIHEVWERVGL